MLPLYTGAQLCEFSFTTLNRELFSVESTVTFAFCSDARFVLFLVKIYHLKQFLNGWMVEDSSE